jgi:hydroxyethylthiazole kinase
MKVSQNLFYEKYANFEKISVRKKDLVMSEQNIGTTTSTGSAGRFGQECLTAAFADAQERIRAQRPLVHSITSPVAINDCANAILALGAQPICAEHPKEVAGITRMAKALTVSLANITDARLESILISGRTAREIGIFSVIDAVGVTCSPLRMEHAQNFIRDCHPTVIKGNVSEIRALAGAQFHATGIDVGEADAVTGEHKDVLIGTAKLVRDYAAHTGAVVLASGVIDLISNGRDVYAIHNGSPHMSRVTGTGCILTCIIGTFLSVASGNVSEPNTAAPLTASLLGTAVWGICGEIADQPPESFRGLGTYHINLLDALSLLTTEQFKEHIHVEKLDV